MTETRPPDLMDSAVAMLVAALARAVIKALERPPLSSQERDLVQQVVAHVQREIAITKREAQVQAADELGMRVTAELGILCVLDSYAGLPRLGIIEDLLNALARGTLTAGHKRIWRRFLAKYSAQA